MALSMAQLGLSDVRPRQLEFRTQRAKDLNSLIEMALSLGQIASGLGHPAEDVMAPSDPQGVLDFGARLHCLT